MMKNETLSSQKVTFAALRPRKLNTCCGHKGNTTNLENEIDQLGYELYDLTEEEIKIIEEQ